MIFKKKAALLEQPFEVARSGILFKITRNYKKILE